MATNGELVEVTQIIPVPSGTKYTRAGNATGYDIETPVVALAVVRHDHGGHGLYGVVNGPASEFEVETGYWE